jgi:hypothetical protein
MCLKGWPAIVTPNSLECAQLAQFIAIWLFGTQPFKQRLRFQLRRIPQHLLDARPLFRKLIRPRPIVARSLQLAGQLS